jgi:hypothetical protein
MTFVFLRFLLLLYKNNIICTFTIQKKKCLGKERSEERRGLNTVTQKKYIYNRNSTVEMMKIERVTF